MNKDQSVLAKEIKVFASKEILLQHSVSSYRIDLSFPMIKKDRKTEMNTKELKEEMIDENIFIVNLLGLISNKLTCMLKLVKYRKILPWTYIRAKEIFDGTIFRRGRAYIREENTSISNLLTFFLFLFSSIKLVLWHISRCARYEICSKLTIKTPKYIR